MAEKTVASVAEKNGRAPTRPGLVLLVMCTGMFLVLLDVTIVNVAVPGIASGLRTTTSGVQWVVDAYTVGLASALLGGGALGDRWGHRRSMLAGLVVFGTASAGCALAPGVAALVAARAVQGVGAALLLPGSVALITAACPERAAQARALGVWAGISSLALPAGPLLGGLLVSTESWRWVFWVNPPLVALAVGGLLLWVPSRAGDPSRRLDPAGVLLAALTLAAAVYAVIAAGRGARWSEVWPAGVLAVLGAAALVAVERSAPAPVLPLPLVRARAVFGSNTVALLMNLTTNGTLFVVTLYVQTVRGHDAMSAGAMLLPMSVPLVVLALPAGRMTARWGPRRPLLWGTAFAGAGELGLLLVDRNSGYPVLAAVLLAAGTGIGLAATPIVAAAVGSLPPDRAGVAGALNNTARQTGTALGVAVFGAIAGSADHGAHFVSRVHVLAVAAAALWAVAAATVLLTIPSPHRSPHPAPEGATRRYGFPARLRARRPAPWR